MTQKLVTKEIEDAIKNTPYASTDGIDRDEKKVIARYFNPCGTGTWYVLENDDWENGRVVFGAATLGYGLEVPGDPDATRGNAIDLYYTPADPSKSPYMAGNYNSPKVMKYPLKIVQRRCAYEDAEPCTDDPNQGCGEPK